MKIDALYFSSVKSSTESTCLRFSRNRRKQKSTKLLKSNLHQTLSHLISLCHTLLNHQKKSAIKHENLHAICDVCGSVPDTSRAPLSTRQGRRGTPTKLDIERNYFSRFVFHGFISFSDLSTCSFIHPPIFGDEPNRYSLKYR